MINLREHENIAYFDGSSSCANSIRSWILHKTPKPDELKIGTCDITNLNLGSIVVTAGQYVVKTPKGNFFSISEGALKELLDQND